tara:strand:+ start:37 stop:1110 length:1074 start_codon:yes stop_codon:yes gene_type:complete
MTQLKAPFPYYGGKSRAASAVWQALGDVHHYVEPFAGSLAVLLRRPHLANRPYYSETVNDVDGLLVNFWRALRGDPDEVALHASWPVSEADLHARHLAILRWRTEERLLRLMGDADFYDAKIAGWWVWGLCTCVRGVWCNGDGPWVADDDGRFVRQPNTGRGVRRSKPSLSDDGKGVNKPQHRERGLGDPHPVTMPKTLRWLRALGARLRHVRILNGDWTRAVTRGVTHTLSVRERGVAGVFLDPPYGAEGIDTVYTHDSSTIAQDVTQWCLEHGDDESLRVVVAGFDVEHTALTEAGWRVVEWYDTRDGGVLSKGGYGKSGAKGSQMHRDRLWLSPSCLGGQGSQVSIFDLEVSNG